MSLQKLVDEITKPLIKEDVNENEEWIDNFTPPPEVRDTVDRVRDLELQIKELQVKQQGT